MGSSGEVEAKSRRGELSPPAGSSASSVAAVGAALRESWAAPPQEARAPRGAVIGEALVLTARELRLVLTLLLVMFMTGEAWRYVGTLAGPRLLVVIAGLVLSASAPDRGGA